MGKIFDFAKSKTGKIIITLLSVSIIFLLIYLTIITAFGVYELYLYICNSNADIVMDEDINSYFNNTYTEYNGGTEAKIFFDEYVHTDQYKDAAFHYIDGEKINHYYNYFTVFVLDIYYKKDDYCSHFNNITQYSDKCVSVGKCTISSDSYFDVYRVVEGNDVYESNSAYILFHPKYNTIRYVFILNQDVELYELKDCVDRSMTLRWNGFQELEPYDIRDHWIFDYSDIIDIEYSEE